MSAQHAPARHSFRVGTAFTLAETLIVTAILTVLAALIVPAGSHAVLVAKMTNVRHDLRQVQIAIWQYYLDHQALPPTRKYCLAAKRDLDYGLPPELWEGQYLDGPFYDVFSPGQTYRYSAIGPYSFNDSPAGGVLRYYVPAEFPRSGGSITGHVDAAKAPVRCILWSAGPGGPAYQVCYSLDGIRAENPVYWYPGRADGLLCYYWDGMAWHFSF
jgi:type II secretory pathway pseudopilin PulG